MVLIMDLLYMPEDIRFQMLIEAKMLKCRNIHIMLLILFLRYKISSMAEYGVIWKLP